LRKLALGKLQWRPQDFYDATLGELADAMNGYAEHAAYRDDVTDFYIRKLCFYLIAPHQDNKSAKAAKKESDLWRHRFDKDIEQHRIKNTPKAEITFSDDE